MSEQKLYHPLVEKIRQEKWGVLGLVEPEDVEQWALLKDREKAQYLGARVDCPVVETLADDPKYGPRYQIQRYADVARTALQLADEMKLEGSPLVEEFLAPVDLTPMGGKQKHDHGWVPLERINQASGAETYFAFVLSRQVIDVRNARRNRNDTVAAWNKEMALGSVAYETESLQMAVAKLGLLSIGKGIAPEKAIGRMFPDDWAEELPGAYWKPIFAEVKELFEDLSKKK